jgi:hypothetical protein
VQTTAITLSIKPVFFITGYEENANYLQGHTSSVMTRFVRITTLIADNTDMRLHNETALF